MVLKHWGKLQYHPILLLGSARCQRWAQSQAHGE
jgi:hypothetical protein